VLGRLSITQKLSAVVVAPLVVLAGLTGAGFYTFQKVKVNGPEYQKISQADTLIADILPPPLYILETQYVALEMLRAEKAEFDTLKTKLASLEKDYKTRQDYWKKNLSQIGEPKLTAPLLEDSTKFGNEYFKTLDKKFLPALEAAFDNGYSPADTEGVIQYEDAELAKTIFKEDLTPLYENHRKAIDTSVELATKRSDLLEKDTKSTVSRSLLLLGALALIGAALAVAIGTLVANAIRRPIKQLTDAANRTATTDLPELVQQAQNMTADSPMPTIAPVIVDSTDELGLLANAFSSMQSTAVGLASEQAIIRRNVSENLVNLARRNQLLLGRSLGLLTQLEQNERDPDKLQELFRIDHLTTRMRRNAESLLVLANAEPARPWSDPIDIGDVVRAAVSAIESFDRVDIIGLEPSKVKGALVSDVAHLLAELIENATNFSSPTTRVAVIGKARPDGYLLVITDDGIGMTPNDLDQANSRITAYTAFDTTPSKVLGLNVVGRLANRHGVEVSLAESATAGIAARIVLPAKIIDGLAPVAELMPSYSETLSAPMPQFAPELVAVPNFDTQQPAPLAAPMVVEQSNVRELRRGLSKRVRGAQMPDVGPAAEAELPLDDADERPASVMASLSNLQAGVQRGREHDVDGDAAEVVQAVSDEVSEPAEIAASSESESPSHVSVAAHESIWASEGESTQHDSLAETGTPSGDTFAAEFEPEFEPAFEPNQTFTQSGEVPMSPHISDQSDSVWAQTPSSVSTMVEEAETHGTLHDSFDSVEEPEDTVESLMAAAAIAEAMAPSTTTNGLSRRVRGAQMPDTGPAVDRTLGMDSDPDHVRQALGSLQRGVANAHAENNTDNHSNDF
jgi:signal transduction histidine kinase